MNAFLILLSVALAMLSLALIVRHASLLSERADAQRMAVEKAHLASDLMEQRNLAWRFVSEQAFEIQLYRKHVPADILAEAGRHGICNVTVGADSLAKAEAELINLRHELTRSDRALIGAYRQRQQKGAAHVHAG